VAVIRHPLRDINNPGSDIPQGAPNISKRLAEFRKRPRNVRKVLPEIDQRVGEIRKIPSPRLKSACQPAEGEMRWGMEPARPALPGPRPWVRWSQDMSSHDYLPSRESELVDWSRAFSDAINLNPGMFSLLPAQAAQYQALHLDYEARYPGIKPRSIPARARRPLFFSKTKRGGRLRRMRDVWRASFRVRRA
jgi:hypothetical protein